MNDVEELKARLLLIHDHDGNDLSPNDKRGLRAACDELDKLKRYEEREPLVQALIETVQDHDKTNLEVMEAAERVDLFKLE